MIYKVPQNIDSNKIFLVNRSEIEGRWDPQMILYSSDLLSFAYPMCPLKKLLMVSPQYGANEEGKERKNINEPRYIRITDIDEYGLLNDSIGVTADKVESKYILNNNDILFARSGATVGKAYLHKDILPYKSFFAGYLIRIVVDKQQILPEYLFSYTQLRQYKKWVGAIQRTAAQPNINAEEYKSLLIPLPPLKIQQRIVDIMKLAYQQKRQKEAESQKLLDSIDDYLLGELEITLPQQNEVDMKDIPAWMSATNPLVKNGRLFMTGFKEIEGGRLDPVNTLYLGKRTQSSKYTNIVLKDIAYIEKGQSITSSKILEGEYPVIAGGQSSPYSHNGYNYGGNIITISASGAYAGYVWFHNYPIFASDCSVIHSKHEDKYLTKYIFEVLKAQQNQIYLLQQGAGQPHVYPVDLAKLSIPDVPTNMQNKICKHIDELRNGARQLKNEAINILQTAKKQVEQIILSK